MKWEDLLGAPNHELVEQFLWNDAQIDQDIDANKVRSVLLELCSRFATAGEEKTKSATRRCFHLLTDLEMLPDVSRMNNVDADKLMDIARIIIGGQSNNQIMSISFRLLNILYQKDVLSPDHFDKQLLTDIVSVLESFIHHNAIKESILSLYEKLLWNESVAVENKDLFDKDLVDFLLPILMDILLMSRNDIEICRSSIHIVLGLKNVDKTVLVLYYNNIIAALVSVLSEKVERDATTLIISIEVIDHILTESNDDGHLLEVIPCIFSHFSGILTHILELFDARKGDSDGEGASMQYECIKAVVGLLRILSKAWTDRDILTLALDDATINHGVEKLSKDLSLQLPMSRLNEIDFYVGKSVSADKRGVCDEIKTLTKSLQELMEKYMPNSSAENIDDSKNDFSGSISSFLDKMTLSNHSTSTRPNDADKSVAVEKSNALFESKNTKRNVVVPSPIETTTLAVNEQSVTPRISMNKSPSLDSVSRLVNDTTRLKTQQDQVEKDKIINELLLVSKVNQDQAVEAIKRADMLQELFIDATKKIELLMKENENLRKRVDPAAIAHQSNLTSPRDGDSPRSARRVTISTKPLPAASESTTSSGDNQEMATSATNETEDRLKSLAMGGLLESLNTLKDRKEDGDSLVIDTDVNALYPAAEKVKELFEFLKFAHVGFAAERRNLESLALSTLRRAMTPLGFIEADIFTLNDVDIIFSQLGVQQVSLFGLSYVLMNCLRKRFKYLTVKELVAKLMVMTTEYLEQQKNKQTRNNGRQRKTSELQPTIHQDDISDNDWDELKKLLDMEQSAIDVIFRAYRPNSPLKQGRNRTTNKDIQVMSYESAVHFALDIGIIPSLLTTTQFHSIARNSLFYDQEDPSEYGQLSIEQFKNVIVNLALCVPLFKKSLEKERTKDTDIPATVLLSYLFLFMRTNAQLWHTNISKRSSHRGAIALPVLKFKLDTIRARSSVQAAAGETEKKRMIMSMCAPSKEHVFGINTGDTSKTFLRPTVPKSNRF